MPRLASPAQQVMRAVLPGCVLEMILKDTHTCGHCPERFDRWTEIARQEVERLYA